MKKVLFSLLFSLSALSFSAEIADVSFETDTWDLVGSGVVWDGPADEITIMGDGTYQTARVTVDVPVGTTDLYFSGEVYFEDIVNGSNAWNRPKFKFLYPGTNTTIQACNFDNPSEDVWFSNYCHVADFNTLGITQVTIEIGMQNALGTYKVRVPKITDTEPVVTPYSFPFTTPANPSCTIDLISEEVELFNNDLLSSNCHFSFNWPDAMWGSPIVGEALTDAFPHSNYRFPGGTVGNFYNWKTDGYHNDASTFDAPFRQSLYNDGFVFDYLGFKDQVINSGGSATLMFNVIHDNVDTATARLRSRLSDGLNVEWVELGNENYFPTQAYGNISNGSQTPDVATYIAHTSSLTSSLKAEDPSIKVAVNINHLSYDAGGWSDLLSQETYYDATVLHNYISPRDANLNFNSGSELLRSYQKTKYNLDEYKLHFSQPTIVTEWGLQEPPESFLSVIASAEIFMALLDEGFNDGVVKQSGIHMFYHSDVNQHQTSIYVEGGSIRYTATGVFFSKLFDVFKDASIYRANSSSDLLDVDLPSVNARVVDLGDSVKVFAVNKLPVASELDLSLDGASLENGYKLEVFTEDILSGWPSAYVNTADAWVVSSGTGTVSLPAYSISVVTVAKNGVATSINGDQTESKVTVFPNPVKDAIILTATEVGETVVLLNTQGEVLCTKAYDVNGIDVCALKPGVYLVRKGEQTLKFIKD